RPDEVCSARKHPGGGALDIDLEELRPGQAHIGIAVEAYHAHLNGLSVSWPSRANKMALCRRRAFDEFGGSVRFANGSLDWLYLMQAVERDVAAECAEGNWRGLKRDDAPPVPNHLGEAHCGLAGIRADIVYARPCADLVEPCPIPWLAVPDETYAHRGT